MFYAPCNLGFEKELCMEIEECWPLLIGTNGLANQEPLPEMKADHGGVQIECAFELGLQLNFFLKIAHRVLFRLAEFRVRDFPKLFEKVQNIPWTKHLGFGDIEWVVSASKSRLNNEKRIEDTCREALQKSLRGLILPSGPAQKIYVRIFDDLCTLSLDCSGEHLHKRGWGRHKGEAPLRETLAAFALKQMMKGHELSELQRVTLVDPMCGSGTLVLEAASLWNPAFRRDYSFLRWKSTPKIFKTTLWKKNYKLLATQTPFKKYLGFDLDEKVLRAAQENLQEMSTQLEKPFTNIEFKSQNLFDQGPVVELPVWCVSNPPYGERLRVQGQADFSYEDLLAQIVKKFTPQKVGLLLPAKSAVKKLQAPKGYKKNSETPFSNGGLDILLLIYTGSPRP
jgi:putative N6-adenine-specific DNA methylase